MSGGTRALLLAAVSRSTLGQLRALRHRRRRGPGRCLRRRRVEGDAAPAVRAEAAAAGGEVAYEDDVVGPGPGPDLRPPP
ncbi:hypothetical protein U9M48_032059 [Paspalum notatum var. saurae]|uniref:Uncharacterized protein n=1 Tax=Paspalum notatum var. saurae TaxID=547442 RepID=A0AAQ3U6I3_PASNO